MARTLDVYLCGSHVGVLTQDDHGQIAFDYAKSWLDNPRAVPLSCSLPLRKERYTREECEGYFSGILPEGDGRRIVAKNLGISASNDFAMLERIGGECAGAVTFIATGEKLSERNDSYRPLTSQELADILRVLPRRPLMAGEDGVRLSLAGAQDKLAVYLSNGQIALPLNGAHSTHILKLDSVHFAGMIFNEAFSMRLARAVGLPTAPVVLGKVGDIDYLLVERYDRVLLPSSLERLHQEDFCQALGIISERKYQREGGLSLKHCFDLVRKTSSIPVIDLRTLRDGVIFNFLIGNNDAHGKNFSLLYRGASTNELTIGLAPLYDLLSTAYYPEVAKLMAMKIGGEYDSERVYARHFERFAEETNLAKPSVKRRVGQMAETLLSKIPGAMIDHPVVGGVAALIQKRCDLALKRF